MNDECTVRMWTNSFLFLSVCPDVLGVRVIRPKNVETTARGAAVAAGVGAGLWTEAQALADDDCDEGSTTQIVDVVDPASRTGNKSMTNNSTAGETFFEPAVGKDERVLRYARWCDAVNRSLNLA